MPAFSFTANATSNTITIAGHGLTTGDGPIAVRTVGGVLPAPLVAQTDYWVIRVDANTLRLATSTGHANAGSFIYLATAGSGTQLLEIGVPYRRPITYVPRVSQIRSADLNANFDAWKALHALLTGQAQSVWDGVRLVGPLVIEGDVSIGGVLARPDEPTNLSAAAFGVGGGAFLHTSGLPSSAVVSFPSAGSGPFACYALPLPVGHRLRSVEWWFTKRGQAMDMEFMVSKTSISTGAVTIIDTVTSASTLTDRQSLSRSIDYVAEPGHFVNLLVQQAVSGSGPETSLFGAKLVADVPMPA